MPIADCRLPIAKAKAELRWWTARVPLIGALLILQSAIGNRQCHAHPVPRSEHDRNVTVNWRADGVFVKYRLEIDEYTLLTTVARWLADQPGDTRKPIGPKEIADAYIARMKAVIPDNLIAKLDGKEIHFTCTDGKVAFLDSAQFEFRLKAAIGLNPGKHTLKIEDINFLDKKGRLAMKFESEPPLTVQRVSEPPESRITEATEADRRTVSATVLLAGTLPTESQPVPPPGVEPVPPPAPEPEGFWDLFRKVNSEESLSVLLNTNAGLGLILLLAFLHGAIHSAAPGHGKTMVAAYLIGEQGTPKHAIILGFIVTLTHTSTAFAVALLLKFVLPPTAAPAIQSILGVGGGLLVAFIGLWLFMTRLAGRSDHVHLGSHSHAHTHSHSHSHGDGHTHSHGLTPEQFARVNPARLVLLGISGGLIPCWGAILWVLYCVTAGRYGLALWAVLAFSVGLALVLIVIGLSVVWGARIGTARFGRRYLPALAKWLPIIGAALVVVIGLWLVEVNLPK
jgi:ABC-type nickel/cobalt efflux system permease component RcnA